MEAINKMRSLVILTILFFLTSCSSNDPALAVKQAIIYQNTIGDIAFDEKLDNPDFIICHPYFISPQYYYTGLSYEGELFAIDSIFRSQYNLPKASGQSGIATIRFVVNCSGETGRFRFFGVNKELEECSFQDSIKQKLLAITKGLKGWKIMPSEGLDNSKNGDPLDYYQYLVFQLIDGQIKEIGP